MSHILYILVRQYRELGRPPPACLPCALSRHPGSSWKCAHGARPASRSGRSALRGLSDLVPYNPQHCVSRSRIRQDEGRGMYGRTTPGLDTGLRIDTGCGFRPVTVGEWNETLARMCHVHRGRVVPADDDARRNVERVHPRRDPETRRLLALRPRRSAAKSLGNAVASRPAARFRAPRGRRVTSRAASRRGPPSGDEPHEHDLVRRALIGGAA